MACLMVEMVMGRAFFKSVAAVVLVNVFRYLSLYSKPWISLGEENEMR